MCMKGKSQRFTSGFSDCWRNSTQKSGSCSTAKKQDYFCAPVLYNNPRFTKKKKRFFKSIQDIRSAKLELENRKTSRWSKMVCLRIEDVYFCCVCNILKPPKLSMINPNQLILKLERNGPYIVNFCIVNMALLVLILDIIDEKEIILEHIMFRIIFLVLR